MREAGAIEQQRGSASRVAPRAAVPLGPQPPALAFPSTCATQTVFSRFVIVPGGLSFFPLFSFFGTHGLAKA